jgi:hypothetical protein
LRTAYKFYDIQTDYLSGTYQRPLQAKHRFFGNLGYETPVLDKGKQWKFDYTLNWLGNSTNYYNQSDEDRLPEFSPSFSVMNIQVTRIFSDTLKYTLAEKILEITNRKMYIGQ